MSVTPVTADAGRILVGDRRLPLIAGEIQFWRMDPAEWEPAVRAARDSGVPIVSTYLSWRRHEPVAGRLDFSGATDPRLDVRAFLRICRELDVVVQLKPGPWICAEEPGGGYPDWLLEREELLARDDEGQVVIGYNPPFLHPVPSYSDPAFRAIVQRWFHDVWDVIGEFVYPHGPVVAMQLDNEPSSSFQDAMYAGDYSQSSVDGFRTWLAHRYAGDVDAFRAAWNTAADFGTVQPPRRPAQGIAAAARTAQHDWIEYKTHATAEYLSALKQLHVELGGGALLYTVNLVTHPIHDVPVAHRAIREGVGAITGEDHYYIPPLDVADIHRLARSAATARAAGEPIPWVPELQAGIWRSPGEAVDYPDPTPLEQEIWWGAAFTLGFSGANLYMLVDRENWEYSPVGASGEKSAFFRPVRRLAAAVAAEPELLTLPVRCPVVVAWHRADAYDAYAVVGTSRVPDVAWGDTATTAAYRSWDETLLRLTERGIPFDLWDTTTELTADPAVPVIVPDGCGVSPGLLDALVSAGRRIVSAGPDSGWAELGSIGGSFPTIVTDSGPLASTLTTARESADASSIIVHVVHWGAGEADARMLLPATDGGELRSLHDGTVTLVADHVASVSIAPGHHVFVLTRTDAPAPTPPHLPRTEG
jgi:hypothetical protein